MNRNPDAPQNTPEKLRSALWLILALMLFLGSSFAESSWSNIGPASQTADPAAATAGTFYVR